jgi:methylenetetrahydrofolate dehydrogenase (NADP+) / methenyltetrahydrofolate cyclohydrolase
MWYKGRPPMPEARIIDGRRIAADVRLGLAPFLKTLAARGVVPALHVVLVGDDPASESYVRTKARACAEVGIGSEVHRLPADVSEGALFDRVGRIAADEGVSGVIVQLPLPGHLDEARCRDAVPPEKDVDGFHAINLGHLMLGEAAFAPCTPLGIMHLLAAEQVPVEGAAAVVVGRGHVGLPLAAMLTRAGATVTVCHSRTRGLKAVTAGADILVSATGIPALIGADMVRPGAAVIDVGIRRLPDGNLAGDVDFAAVRARAGRLTPVPGGVGPMTVAMLLRNTVRGACRRAGIPGP